MPRKCTVCSYEQCAAIDRAIIAGESNRSIAKRHPGVSESAIQRHRAHIRQAIIRAKDAEIIAVGKTGYERFSELWILADEALRKAVGDRDKQGWHQILARYLELAHKLGMEERNAVVLERSPEWITLRTEMLTALLPYKEARDAILGAMRANKCSGME